MAYRPVPLLLLALLLVVCPVEAQDKEQEKGPASPDALRDSIEAEIDSAGVPGAGVVLFSADSIRWEGYFGVADRASGRPVTEKTVFRAGSISKSVVSTASLLMVEEGRLDLQAPVRDLAPEIKIQNPWADTDPVRVAHLLEHTAGFDDFEIHEYVSRSPNITLREGLAINPATRQVRWRPGMYSSYSNAGPPVAAYIVEKKSGQPFNSFVIDRIFEPLGMGASSFLRDDRTKGHLATGYAADGETEKPYLHFGLRPSGALNARPTDLARFGQMLLGRGTRGGTTLLDSASVERMEMPQASLAARSGLQTGYGLGNRAHPRKGFVYRGHGGSLPGFRAQYGYLPTRDRGYVVMLNSPDLEAISQIVELVRDYQTRPLTPPEPAPIADLPADTLAKRSGYYVWFTPPLEIARFAVRLLGIAQIDTTTNGLSVNPVLGTADTLLPVDAQRFRARGEPVPSAVFARNQNGQMIFARSGLGFFDDLRPISAVSAWGRWIAAGLSLLLLASTLLFALYWIPAKALGRLRNRESIHLRLWPLVATLALAGAALALALGSEDLIRRLGTPTVYSIGYAGLTLTYGLAVLASLWALVRSKARAHWGTWTYHAFVVGAETLVLVYLAAHGLIGHRFWT